VLAWAGGGVNQREIDALYAIAHGLEHIAEAIEGLSKEKPKQRAPSKRSKTPPPDDLSAEDKRALHAWCKEQEPWAVAHLRRLVDDMLLYHRTEGKGKANWYMTAQRWITNARVKYGEDKKPASRGNGRGDVIDAAQRIAEELGLRRAPQDDDAAFFDVSAERTPQH
jgi:hypothetical protein